MMKKMRNKPSSALINFGNIMLAFPVKNIVGVGSVYQVLYADSGFFKYLSPGTFFYGLGKFQMTAWKRPGAFTMGIFAFTQKNFVILDYNDGNTDKRSTDHFKACSGSAI